MGSDFRILGELEVLHDGRRCDLGPHRERGLLARLILRSGQTITTDHLLDELWPDGLPATARHTLHVYVSRLRKSLGPDRDRLRSDTSGYRLILDPHELDAARFERLAAAGRTALSDSDPHAARSQLGAALDMWRGPALAEFVDESFAGPEATRLDQLRWVAIESRVQASLDLGRHAELTEELRELTLEQPFRELLWEQLMLALYRSRRQVDALRIYAEARMRLVDDLGIEPGPGYDGCRSVLAHDPTLSQAPRPEPPRPEDNLPLQRTSFVGRTRDLAIAAELLSTCRLLTLTGAPGSGKTRLAIRLAGDHADRYRDGVAFVPLAPVDDARRLESVIGSTLGVPESGDRSMADALALHLRERRLLLVLDNFEHIVEAASRIGALLDACPDITFLVTSRARLGIAGEQEFPVLPLQVPPVDAIEPTSLRAYDAVSLFLSRARALDPTFDLNAGNAPTIAAITARLDGLPLALELGASRLRLLTPQVLLRRLEHRLPTLDSGPSDAIDRHRTLRSAIAWSYELLEPSEQAAFRRLGAFIGTFNTDAAAAITCVPLDDVWDIIDSLLAQNLLVRPVDTGEARFAMLATLREFAVGMLEAEGEHQDVGTRHAHHYVSIAEYHESELIGEAHHGAMECLALEVGNIRAALRFCEQSGQLELGLRLAGSIWRFWQRSGQMAEGRDWLERLLRGASAAHRVRAKALVALAGLAYWQADLDAGWSAYAEALELYRSLDDHESEAAVLLGMSMTATWRGDPETGGSLAVEARSLFDREGDRAKVGEALMAEGFALWQMRDYAAARPKWEAALDISRELGDETQAVTQLAGLAGIAFHEGRRDEAVRVALDALAQARELDNVSLSAWLLDFVAAFVAADAPDRAVRIAGAADVSRTAAGGGLRIGDLHIDSAQVVAARALSPEQLQEAWTAGRAMTLEQAVDAAFALGGADGRSTSSVRAAESLR